MDAAVQTVIDRGVTVVADAENSNKNACTSSLARVPEAVTVGATTITYAYSTTGKDVRASYSIFGTCLDLFAPESAITSAWNTSNNATNTISGSSNLLLYSAP